MRNPKVAVLGAGVTGLAVGSRMAVPVFEQGDQPGGICRSYYVRPGEDEVLDSRPRSDDAYRFEVGGGHWLFGGDPATLGQFRRHLEFRSYSRRAVVRLAALDRTVPYPLQSHVAHLGPEWEQRVESDRNASDGDPPASPTLEAWLLRSFGVTLCELFFLPFHDRYTAGLTAKIAPQDAYKSPSTGTTQGYNPTFLYPVDGLDGLAGSMAKDCEIHFCKQVIAIDWRAKTLVFADGTDYGYDRLLSTLPLNWVMSATGIEVDEPPDPHTSVLVLNIGAERGPALPDAHWQYESDSISAFHRIGFYSNVDLDFLPRPYRNSNTHVSMYVERAFPGGYQPSQAEVSRYQVDVERELFERGYIGRTEVVHPTWVDVAYTWRRPASTWREKALSQLRAAGIEQIGRYGRWTFQGIADSVREGFVAAQQVGEG